jgi:hypothetical protein
MGDDIQVIDDALSVLREIQREYRNAPIADLAALMSEQIRPTMAFDSAHEERQRILFLSHKGNEVLADADC